MCTVLHTENVARGQTEFPKCRGDKGVYKVLTFQKSRGGKSSPRGVNAPPPLLNEILVCNNYTDFMTFRKK